MPLITQRGSMSGLAFGFTLAGVSGWIGSFPGSGSGSLTLRSITKDGSGFIYPVYTYASSATYYGTIIAKISTEGTLTWQRSYLLSGTGTTEIANSYGVVYNPTYAVAAFTGYQSNYGETFAYYSTSSAALSLNKQYGTFAYRGQGIACDSSGNFYIAGQSDNSGGNGLFQKLDVSGTLLFQFECGVYSTGVDYLSSVCVDPTFNSGFYFGRSISTIGTRSYWITRLTSGGSIYWSRFLSGTGITVNFSSGPTVCCDSSANVYFCGADRSVNASFDNGLVAKYDANGFIQWQKYISTAGANITFNSIAIDSSNNLYVVGTFSTINAALVVKYNSSGVVQWVRSISATYSGGGTPSVVAYTVTIDGTSMYVGGTVTGGNGASWIIKMPTDGSLIGSFINSSWTYTIALQGLATGNNTLTDSNSGLSLSSSSLSPTTAPATSSASSLTFTKTST